MQASATSAYISISATMSADRNDDGTDPSSTRTVSKNAPAWKYFEPYDPPGREANKFFRCKFCKKYFTDHATRAKAHLHGNVIKGDAPACQNLYGYIGLNEIDKIYRIIHIPTTRKFRLPDGSHRLTNDSVHREEASTPRSQASMRDSNHIELHDDMDMDDRITSTTLSNPIMDAYQVPNRTRLDRVWAKAFYAAGIPFNVSENPFFREAVQETAKGVINGYSLPTMRALRESLLEETKVDLTSDMSVKMRQVKSYGYSLSSDGWENIRREPLMNIMLLTKNGDFFLDSWNAAQADKKDSKYLGDMWCKYIDEVGPEHIVQIVTDGAPANRRA